MALGTIADPSYAREEPGDSNTSGMNEADEEEKGVIGECQGQTSKAMSRSARYTHVLCISSSFVPWLAGITFCSPFVFLW